MISAESRQPTDTPRRRRVQFSLAKLLFALLACSLLFAYTAWWRKRVQDAHMEANRARLQAVRALQIAELEHLEAEQAFESALRSFDGSETIRSTAASAAFSELQEQLRPSTALTPTDEGASP